ncbi:MAG: phosphotransferase family protein [Mycobacteriaceae bacterium]|nr:phosphotransferase family protein [Mycobacteriaceae bacterium]MBV9638057.1 phosphotransferase family protein [Mycobacteriaceae bacterium]
MAPTDLLRPTAEELPALLEPALRQHVPGSDAIENWRPADRGLSTETFLFDAIDSSGETVEQLVFRRPPAVALYPDYDLLRQVLVMNRLRHTAIPVPRVIWFDRAGRALGTPYCVMEHVPNIGTTGDFPSYHTSGLYFDADEHQRAKMWWGCVKSIADVHLLDWRTLRLESLLMPERGARPLQQVLDYYRATLRWASADQPRPELTAAVDWLSDNVYEPRHLCLCWGDSRLSNVLYGPRFEVAAVVDWEVAYIGDHEADLAWLLFLDWSFSEHQQIPRLPGTPTRDETIAGYREWTGWPVRNLRYNEVLAAVALACPVLRLQSRLLADGLVTADADLVGFCVERIRQLL